MRHPGWCPMPSEPTSRALRAAPLLLLPFLGLSAGQLDPHLRRLKAEWLQSRSKVASRIVAGETFLAPGHGVRIQGEEVVASTTISLRDTSTLDRLGIRYTRVTPTVVTAEVPLSALEALEQAASITRVDLAQEEAPHNDINMAKIRVNVPYQGGYTGSNVLVGIVDSGIDLNHPAFRVGGVASGNSRVLALWDQNVSHVPFSVGTFASTKGRLWTNAEINAGQCTQVDTSGHGTHVAGSAAGYDAAFPTRNGGAKGANLLVAKYASNTADSLNAVVWMLEQAKAIGKPIVVNMSVGNKYGPHDGTDTNTKALDDLIAASNGMLIVVRSAGNSGDDGHHVRTTVGTAGTQVPLTVKTYTPSSGYRDANDFTFFYDASASVSMRIRDTSGATSAWFAPSASAHTGTLPDGTGYMIESSPQPEAYNPSLKCIYMTLGEQSSSGDTRNPRVGAWTFEFKTDSGSTTLDAWNYYPINVPGSTDKGVPTAFNTPTVDTTLGNAACGRNIISVAAYVSRKSWPSLAGNYSYKYEIQDAIATFSAIGPTRDARQKPDITGGGALVLSTRSAATTETPDNSDLPPEGSQHYVYNQGTSMSSPTVAGAVALLKERFPNWTYADVITYFKSNSQGTTVLTTPGTWNKNWGWGVIDLLNSGQAVSVAIAPSGTVQAQPGASVAFKATVTGATNKNVAWSVPFGGGSITPSTTAGDGVATATYTAPTAVGTYVVTATSVEDPARKASTSVVVVDTSAITVAVSPATKTLQPSGTFTFTATAQGAPSPGTFTWSASGGTINASTGAYTAPAAPGTYTVTALSSWGPSGTATVQVKTLDLNGDGAIDTLDVLQLTKRWNSKDAADLAKADLNGDGAIDDLDLNLLQNAL